MTHGELLDKAQERVSSEPLAAEVYVAAAQVRLLELHLGYAYNLSTISASLEKIVTRIETLDGTLKTIRESVRQE